MKAPTWLKRLKLWSVALVDQPANPEAQVVLFKSATEKTDATAPMIKCEKCGGDHLTADHETVTKQPGLSDVHAPAPQLHKEWSMDTQADREKVVSLQKKLDEQTAANATLVERLEKVEALQKRERYLQKAALYKHVPGLLPEDFGTILMKIDSVLNQEERDKFDGMLKSTEAALRQAAIFAEFGRTGEREGSEPEAQLQKIAKSIQEADPKMTFASAYAEALKRNPRIYDQFQVEKGRH